VEALLRSGQPLAAGEVLVQRDLAQSLRTIVKEGADSFYRGSLARLTAESYRKHDGLLRYEDLAAFRAQEADPIQVDYKGYSVYQTAGTTSGIVQLIAMNILKGFDLKALGHNSPEYIHVIAETFKLAFADRERYVSDPEHNPIPTKSLLSAEYAALRRKLIRMDRAIRGVAPPGSPQKMSAILEGHSISYEAPGQPVAYISSPAPEYGNTSSFSVADSFGNLLSVTHSVNGTFGAGIVVEGGGYFLNNRLPYFSLKADHVNVLAPGKQTMHTICAALALKDGKPAMAWNTPGGDNQTQALLQAFLNIVEFGMTEQQALEQPTVTTTNLYPSMYPHEPADRLVVPKSLADRAGIALAAKGHKLTVNVLQQPYFQQTSGAGGVKMITVDPKNGVLRGAVSPTKDNYVAGW
jgi:gamma-glutamyltranspeptidase/glutathione hydrolase